ncbi:WSC-domain-containing protein [Thozetella sp. PMI_491]|nr:WSC-domain-containing protein [Thozetella sp. PMI_491]
MQRRSISTVLLWAALASACTIPGGTLSNTITQGFQVQVQNASQPDVHNQYMNLLVAGGGDQHLFIGPVGTPTFDLTLVNGVLTHGGIHAVINGEFSDIDDTTKMFMTERGDPRAIFAPTYACNPDTDNLQVELQFVGRETSPAGGWICVRPTFNNAHEFRYYPPGNDKFDPNRFCTKVTLVVVGGAGVSGVSSLPASSTTAASSAASSPASSSSTSSSPDSSAVSTPSTATSTTFTTSATSAASSGPLPYTDLTSIGFRFIGCAPEQKTVNPPDGTFRTLPQLYASDLMTNQICANYCQANGYAYAGTEFRRECWCGNSYAATRQPGTTLASLSGCSSTCMGDTTQKCGGTDWLSLYAACPAGGPCVNAQFT